MYFLEFSSGHSGYVNCLGIPLMKDSRVIGGALIRQHVTDPKESERTLFERRAKYHDIFHTTNDAITLHGVKEYMLDVNQGFPDLLGYSRDEMLSRKIRDLPLWEALEKLWGQTKRISREAFINFEAEFIIKHGEIFCAEVTPSLLGAGCGG
jgi:PAS domain S-box-containing protein